MKIGIDLGGTNVRMGIVADGKIVDKLAESCKADAAEEVVVDQLKAMIRRLLNPSVESIGIGVPSVVDVEKGIVYDVANIPSWKKVHLKDLLEAEFKVPVAVNNDCNCFALGEYHFGAGAGSKNIVCLALGTGVGAGIIINGKLYVGNNAGAGEIGCIPYLDADYEFYCGSRFFAEKHALTGKEAYERVRAGDMQALSLWQEAGAHIGNLLKAVLFAYDPEMIILGGSISNAYAYFVDAMRESLKTFPYSETVERLKIRVSQKEDIALLGAAMLI
ncbi:sugar kinase [Bacteroidia bacterium]|nr:sugar kinase [Bacteroidia bacterium]